MRRASRSMVWVAAPVTVAGLLTRPCFEVIRNGRRPERTGPYEVPTPSEAVVLTVTVLLSFPVTQPRVLSGSSMAGLSTAGSAGSRSAPLTASGRLLPEEPATPISVSLAQLIHWLPSGWLKYDGVEVAAVGVGLGQLLGPVMVAGR